MNDGTIQSQRISRARIRALPNAIIRPAGKGLSFASEPADKEQCVIVELSQLALYRMLSLKAEHATLSPRITTVIAKPSTSQSVVRPMPLILTPPLFARARWRDDS